MPIHPHPLTPRTPVAATLLRCSFKYLDTSHPAFDMRRCGTGYYRLPLARLRELCGLSVGEFRTSRSSTLRIHRIQFGEHRVAVRGFGVPGHAEYHQHGWQFALSANEHGRVHGFLVADTFFVRWLDPEHDLYPGN